MQETSLQSLQKEALDGLEHRLIYKTRIDGSYGFEPWNEVAERYAPVTDPSELDVFLGNFDADLTAIHSKAYYEFGHQSDDNSALRQHCAERIALAGVQLAHRFDTAPDNTLAYEENTIAPETIVVGLVRLGYPLDALQAAKSFRNNTYYTNDADDATARYLRYVAASINPSQPNAPAVMQEVLAYALAYEVTFDTRHGAAPPSRIARAVQKDANNDIFSHLAAKLFVQAPEETIAAYLAAQKALPLLAGIHATGQMPTPAVIDPAVAELRKPGVKDRHIKAIVQTALRSGDRVLLQRVKTALVATGRQANYEAALRRQKGGFDTTKALAASDIIVPPNGIIDWRTFLKTITKGNNPHQRLSVDTSYHLASLCDEAHSQWPQTREGSITSAFEPYAFVFRELMYRREYVASTVVLHALYNRCQKAMQSSVLRKPLAEAISNPLSRLAAINGDWHDALHGKHLQERPRRETNDVANLLVAYGIHHQLWQR